MAVSESQKRANKKWNKEHKEKTRKINTRSQARSFIRNYSDLDDLKELRKLIDEREKELSK